MQSFNWIKKLKISSNVYMNIFVCFDVKKHTLKFVQAF
jgi:hypothetical protein